MDIELKEDGTAKYWTEETNRNSLCQKCKNLTSKRTSMSLIYNCNKRSYGQGALILKHKCKLFESKED